MLAALLMLALGATQARAFGSGDKGTSGAQFLKLAPGARPSAMGEAFSGVADDVNAAYYNPAGLANLKRVQVTGSHMALFQGVNYEHAALAVPLLSWTGTQAPKNAYGVMALSIYNLSVSGIERRGLVESDSPADTFGSSDLAYALSYGYRLADSRLAVGATAKFVDQKLDSTKGTAAALDLGLHYTGDRASFGAGARNAGTKVKLGTESDPLPLTIFAGAGYKLTESLLGSVEITAPRDNSVSAAFGGEYRHEFGDKLSGAARFGYNSRNTDAGGLSGVSFGLGLGYNNFDFDFALVPFGDLGSAYKYSLVVKF